MAFKLVLFVAMALVPAMVGAIEFVVGDEDGWKLGVNYTEWAEGKQFKVGDTIVFKYNPQNHNVVSVGGVAFKTCSTSSEDNPVRKTGNDVITLTTAGRKWYVCGVSDHCTKGMKLFINVEEAEAPAPSPTGGETNSADIISSYLVGLAAILAMAIMY